MSNKEVIIICCNDSILEAFMDSKKASKRVKELKEHYDEMWFKNHPENRKQKTENRKLAQEDWYSTPFYVHTHEVDING